jgi:hypothetical protein
MANPYNEGYKPVLDHLDVKNRESITAWEERLWQRQQRSEFIDPRDEHGRQFFRKHTSMLSELRKTAKRLQRHSARFARTQS